MYSQLTNSYCWSMLNGKGQLNSLVQTIIAEGEEIPFDKMPTIYSSLKNRQKSAIMTKLSESVENGDIVMVHCNPEKIRIPLYLPFIIVSTGASITACKGIVLLNNCEGCMMEDEYDCNATKLKVSLESCYMALQMVILQNSTKLQASQLVRPSVKIYSHIISECLSRKYSIKLDQDIFNTVLYLVSKYFVKTVMGCSIDDSTLDNYCMAGCINPNITILKKTVSEFEDSDFKNISTLLIALSKHPRLISRLGKLTVSGFIESYINMYDASMMLALENYSYFVFNVLSVNARTYINRYQMLESVVGDDGKKLYASLITTIC